MTETRANMEQTLKLRVIPWLREQGFVGSMPHLRRISTTHVDLLTFQFDLHGGGFIVEIAQCPPAGIVTHWGNVIPAKKARVGDVHPSRRKRIAAFDSAGTDGWFRFDRDPADQIAAQLLQKLGAPGLWADLGPIAEPDRLHLPRSAF